MFNSSYNSLSRCHTPSSLNGSTINGSSPAHRPSPSPKCFGKNTHMLKEDYERERTRWQQKLDEAEQKLTDASIHNSELFQIKAELKRKIIDMEKNQRPLIEQNRRLGDRIRGMSSETKKLEEKMAFVQDDYLSLRDAYDRLAKENAMLKEQRAFPEKLEELSRYRNQVLEYSKCITALRQSGLEKDRRYEFLLQKLKKIRKCVPPKRADEEDRQSCIGSEGSVDSGSLGLDTITEDLDEDVELTAELLRPPMSCLSIEYSLKQQLDLANMSIAELQHSLDNVENEKVTRLSTMVNKLREEVECQRRRMVLLEQELANKQADNDLLDFQLIELTASASKTRDFSDKQCSTDVSISTHLSESFDCGEPRKRHTLSTEFVAASTRALFGAMTSPVLSREERVQIKHGIEIIDCLQNQLSFAETELNMSNCEVGRLRRENEGEAEERRRQTEEELGKKHQKKRELQAEIDLMKKEKKEEAKKFSRQLLETNELMNEKTNELGECIRRYEAEIEKLRLEVDVRAARLLLEEATRGELSARLAQLDERKQAEMAALRTELEAQNERIRVLETGERCLRGELEKCTRELEREKKMVEEKEKAIAEKIGQLGEVGRRLEECEKEAERLSEQVKWLQTDRLRTEQEQASRDLHSRINGGGSGKIRPIERYLMEQKTEEHRLEVANCLETIAELEKQRDRDQQLIVQLGDSSTHLKQIEQLQAYNRELEEQFNSQMDIITALKKKFILMKNPSNGGDHHHSDGWTNANGGSCGDSSNGSPSISTTEDEQYHSEGSDVASISVPSGAKKSLSAVAPITDV